MIMYEIIEFVTLSFVAVCLIAIILAILRAGVSCIVYIRSSIAMKTSEDLVRAFADLFDEVEPETPEEVDAALREAGYDPDQIGARMKSVALLAVAQETLAKSLKD